MYEAIIVGLILGALWFIEKFFGTCMVIRPLVASPLVGLAFMYFAVAFVAILFGSAAVEAFVNNIPETIMQGLNVAGGLLPAVGFALLLLPMMNIKNVIYFVFGFILISYLNLPIMAVTICGVLLAFIVTYEKGQFAPKAAAQLQDGEEDLFDE